MFATVLLYLIVAFVIFFLGCKHFLKYILNSLDAKALGQI